MYSHYCLLEVILERQIVHADAISFFVVDLFSFKHIHNCTISGFSHFEAVLLFL